MPKSNKTQFDPTSDPFKEAQQAVFTGAGTGPGSVADNVPLSTGPSLEEQAAAKVKRQDSASFGDNLGSMWRQDGFVNGLVANIAGSHMVPDAKWNPFDDEKWKQLSHGIADENLPALYDTKSEAHAMYVRDLLLDKQQDQQRLSDLGGWGTAGRFAMGAVSPDQLLAGMVGGRIAQGVKWARMARTPVAAGVDGLVAGRQAAAATAAAEGTVGNLAAGVAGGAAINATFEKLRQKYNFEDDSTAVLEAALMGGGMALPFSVMHLRASRRAADTAMREATGLEALQKAARGEKLEPHHEQTLDTMMAHEATIRDIEAGRMTPDEAVEALDKFHGDEPAATPPEEMVTLYRAESPTVKFDDVFKREELTEFASDKKGIRFTSDKKYADYFRKTYGRDATIRTVSVPKSVAEAGRLNDYEFRISAEHLQAPAASPAPAGFIAKGSIGSGQREAVSSVAEQRTAFAKARYDIFSVLNGSENPEVKKLAFGLVKDPIQVDKDYAQGWTASEWKSHLVRTYKGEAMTDIKSAYQEAVKARGVGLVDRFKGNFDSEFHELVTRVTRGDDSVLAAHPDIAPMLQKAAAAQRKAYDNLLGEATAAGVKGTDTLSPHDNYVNRQWHHEKIREAELLHGKDAVRQLIAGSIKVPGLTGDLEKATRFLDAVKKLEFGSTMHEIRLGGQDMGTLREALRRNGHMTEGDINSIVDTMFEAHPSTADAGTSPRLKYRFDLDENFSIKTKAGDLRISDLTENDSRYLLDTYYNTMAGHTAMAKMGVTSQAEWATRMKPVEEWFTGNVTKSNSGQRDVRYLNDIYANITGRPMSTSDFSTTAQIASGMRAWTRAATLGQLGFAAAFEMKQAAALFGMQAMLSHMPSLGQFLKGLRTGHIVDNKLARDIESMVGFGHEMSMSYARHAEVNDGFGQTALNRFMTTGNKASHTVDILSGNAGITAMTRNWSARAFTEKATGWAKAGKVSDKWRERMVGWGIDADDLDHVLGKLKEHAETTGGKVTGINYEEWARDSFGTYDKFRLAVSRASRDAVQDQDLGETMMFMHSTLGKIFSELKTFFLVAHAKNMLKNLHYRDSTAFQVYTVGLLGEALAYATQTAANYATNPAELDKRLTTERIAKAAFARASVAGFLPFLVDTGYGAITGQQLTQPGTTTNTDNRSFVNTPSLTMVGRIVKAPQTLTGLLTGSHAVTQRDARDLTAVLPGIRLMGAAQLANEFVNTFPKSAPKPQP